MLPRIAAVSFLCALLFAVVGSSNAGAETEVPQVGYHAGFYNLESAKGETWRWMAEEGAAKLMNGKKDMVLIIAGRAPLDALPHKPVIKIFLNGELLDQFDAPEKILEKEYKIPAAKLGNNEWSDLRITTSKAIVPREVDKKMADDRKLGFKLYKLAWSSASGAPIAAPIAAPIVVPEAPAPDSKGWLIAGLILGLTMLLFLAVLGLALSFRGSRSAAKTPAKTSGGASFACPECGRTVKAASAGPKVKCSACGKTVFIPKAKVGDK